MTVSRLRGLASIGVDQMATLADRLGSEMLLRLENLDTDLRPPAGVIEATKQEIDRDSANSYLPFMGSVELRKAAAALVSRLSGVSYHWSIRRLSAPAG